MDIEELLNEETKLCPECAEIIKLKAKKCRFCGAQLDPEKVSRLVEIRSDKLRGLSRLIKGGYGYE